MTDKMGNVNINGVQASEQQDTGHIVANRNPGPSVVSDYAADKNFSSLSTKIEDFHENIMSDQKNTSATDDRLLNRQTSERREQPEIAHAIPNSSWNPSIALDDKVDKNLPVSPMEVEEFSQNTTDQNNTAIRNDGLILRWKSEGREEEKESSVCSNTSKTNEAESILFIDLKSDEQELGDGMCQESIAKSTKKWNLSNTQIDEKGDEVEIAGTEGLFKCDSPDTSSAFMGSMQTVPMEERRSSGDMVLLDHEATEGNNNKDHEQLGFPLDLVSEDPKPFPKENDLSTEQNRSIYLDYIDSEIKRLYSEDNPKVVNEPPETEPDVCERSSNQACNKGDEKISVRELAISDSETDSYDAQREAIVPSHEEDQISDGSDDLATKSVDTDEIKEMESEQKEQHDANPSLMSPENNQDTKEGDILEKEGTLLIDMLLVTEERTNFGRKESNDGKELVEKNDTKRERLHVLPSPSADPIVSINKDKVAETVDLNAKGKNAEKIVTVSEDSNEKTELPDTNGNGFSGSSSYLLDLVDCAGEEMTKKETEELEVTGNTTEERTEQHDEEFGGHVPVSDTAPPEVKIYQTNSAKTDRMNSPRIGPSQDSRQNKTLICNPELEQKHTAEESEALISKVVPITQTGDDIECVNIPSEIARVVNESFVSALEQGNEKHVQEERRPSQNEVMIQAAEASKIECSETIMDSDILSQNSELEFTPVYPSEPVSAIILGTSGRFSSESNQQKENSQDDDRKTSHGLEILITETVTATPNQESADSKDKSLLVCKIERGGHEAKEKSGSKIHAAEAMAQETNHNPSQYHEQTDNGDNFIYEKCAPEINKSMLGCYHNTDYEVISMVGAEALIRVSESSNEESDKSPLLYKKCAGASESSSLERPDSGNLRAPLVSLLKEEVYVLESFEKKECLFPQKPIEEVWRSPVKRITATPSKQKEKQKARSSLFGNCMCCTTAIN